MTMYGSDIEHLLARIAASLEDGVLPHVDDHYAQLQIRAARELLLNLSTRIEWRREDIHDSVQRARECLNRVSELDTEIAGHVRSDSGGLVEVRAELGRTIDDLYHDGGDPAVREQVVAAVSGVIRAEFDADAERVQTGMFSSKPTQEPKRGGPDDSH
jgi:hypothetical protein